jgi:hypothetical protein
METIFVRRVQSSGLSFVVTAKINGISQESILDTGAEVTIISERFHSENNLPPPNRKVRLLNAEDGKDMIGGAGLTISIQIGTSICNWNIIVAPIRDPVLLGLDYFTSIDAEITSKGIMRVNGKVVESKILSRGNAISRVIMDKNISLEPRSETIVSVKLTCPFPCNAMVRCNGRCDRSVLCGRMESIGYVY